MSFPNSASPYEWAEYNSRILGMSPAELDREIERIEETAATRGTLAVTVAALTPTAELVTQVLKVAELLDSGAAPGACADMLRSAVGLES